MPLLLECHYIITCAFADFSLLFLTNWEILAKRIDVNVAKLNIDIRLTATE